MADGSDEGSDTHVTFLTSPQVAEILGIHRDTVYGIPRDELPFLESTGGSQRRGRRRYRTEDVRAYMARQLATPVDRMEDHERRLLAVEDLIQRHIEGHE